MSRWGVVYSHFLGRVFYVDNNKVRYNRLRHRVHDWAAILDEAGLKYRLYMIGVTYSPDQTWHKLDISKLMVAIRKRLGGKLLGYAWVSELQERGEIHYHIMLAVKPGTYIPMLDRSGLWTHGSSHFSKDKPKSPFYIVSYCKKKYQKDYSLFPKYCRAFAVWISDDAAAARLRFGSLRLWQQLLISQYGEGRAKELIEWKKEDDGWAYRSCLDEDDAKSWVEALRAEYADHPPWYQGGVYRHVVEVVPAEE